MLIAVVGISYWIALPVNCPNGGTCCFWELSFSSQDWVCSGAMGKHHGTQVCGGLSAASLSAGKVPLLDCPGRDISPRPRPRGRTAGAGRGWAGPQPVKAARATAAALKTMAQANLQLVLGLALLAICLLALPRDAGARPQERMVGGLQDLSPSDPQVQKAAQSAVASYNMGSNSLYYFRDTHILKAQRQVRLGWRDGERGASPQRPCQIKGEPRK